MDARLDAFLKSASALSLQDRLARARAAAQTAVAARGDPREVYSASPMATDTDARSGDVPSTSAARAEADDALAASKRMHFTYARHYLPPSSPTVTDQPPSLASLGLTPLVDPRAVPDVLRAVLLEDGCVKVNFRDNTVLRLDPTGSAFTVTTPEGETLRQLSEFAVTRFARKLRSALEFRNAHADVPFLPPAIARLGVDEDDGAGAPEGKKTDLRFRASARARYASWSLDAEDAERSGFLTRLEGGGAALESTEGIARVVLSAHGLVARVTYPLLFAVKDASETSAGPADSAESDAAAETDGTPSKRRLAHDYVWHTQTFCADACPARWQFPVALLTRAVYGEGGSDENAKRVSGDAGGAGGTRGQTRRRENANANARRERHDASRLSDGSASRVRPVARSVGGRGRRQREALVELARGGGVPGAFLARRARRRLEREDERPASDGGARARPDELRGAFQRGALRDPHRHRRHTHGPVGGGGLGAGRRRGRPGLRGRREVRRAHPG
jgi:hypothetical protein